MISSILVQYILKKNLFMMIECKYNLKRDFCIFQFIDNFPSVSAQSPKELPEFMKIILSEHQKHFGN